MGELEAGIVTGRLSFAACLIHLSFIAGICRVILPRTVDREVLELVT